MNVSAENTVFALLLALTDLEAPLSEKEKSDFNDVASQLYYNGDAWESEIEPYLRSVIQANVTLDRLYRGFKFQLDAASGNIPFDLPNITAELEEVLSSSEDVQTRGMMPIGNPLDSKNLELFNLAINVMTDENPPETAKKLSSLEKAKQSLKQTIG